MKKTVSFMLVFIMILTFATGCSSTKAPAAESTASTDSTAPTAEAAKTEITLTLGHVVQDGTPVDLGADRFAELVAEKSNGRIKVEVYPNSALGDNRSMLESLQTGMLDMQLPAVAVLSGFTTKTLVFDLPFMFKDTESAEKVLDSEIGANILSGLEDSGLIGLSWWTQGWRVLTTTKTEVHTPADLKGLKIRTMDNKIHIAFWNQLGASAIPMAFSELFTSLQQGVLDGQENPYSNIKLSGFSEVQDYFIETNHIYDPIPMLMSKKTWDKLSKDDQAIITEAAQEAKTFERETAAKLDAKIADELRATSGCNVITLTDEERAAFKKACQPVYDQYADTIGQDLINSILDMQK